MRGVEGGVGIERSGGGALRNGNEASLFAYQLYGVHFYVYGKGVRRVGGRERGYVAMDAG